jgi:hypothetical protein
VKILALALAVLLAVALAADGLARWPGITVNEWRVSPAGAPLGQVFDEPGHPPWSW